LLTDDVVFDYPYENRGAGLSLNGLDAVKQGAAQRDSAAADWTLRNLKVYETDYTDTFFVEFSVDAFVPSTNRSYDGKHLARVTVRDGKIAGYYEIWDQDARDAAFGI
jgi:ketosteroid isomerase-like protein